MVGLLKAIVIVFVKTDPTNAPNDRRELKLGGGEVVRAALVLTTNR